MKAYVKNYSDLAKRLRSVLKEHRCISEFTGQSGVYKAVDGDGNVFLVEWICKDGEMPWRQERLVMDSARFFKESEESSNWFKPDENWSA